ncbi:MAG: ABC transporter permease [Candidatus Tectimicrobiota bacterium]|nr:MAG: ABC transporter permease [Candidatus Tectomicrobia bacterium]
MGKGVACAAMLFCLLWLPRSAVAQPVLRVGSKAFTESYLLAELVAQIAEQVGEARVERHLGLGGTGITFQALVSGKIDLYPEYTGTLSHVILKDPSLRQVAALRARLERWGLTLSEPLGFNNTYALAVRRELAERLGLRRISDLARHPELRAAFSPGFRERADGWPGLQRHYGLRFAAVHTMEHALTYTALAEGRVEVIDVYTTDGKLTRLDLVLLADDRGFFPAYYAVLLARQEAVRRFPRTWQRLQRQLVGRLDDATMARLNARVDLDGQRFEAVAAEFLHGTAAPRRFWRQLLRLTWEHLALVLLALAGAVAAGVPLGVLAARCRGLGQLELMAIGGLQTVPALALLCFMIPLLGIGPLPALVALWLYALLPIVRTTHAGLIALERQLLDIADVLGLSRWQRLWRLELPLASVSILAGIKTAAVFTVGTATLAAFVGGGGYGTLIVQGLALNDVGTILAGAVPAALLALLMHGACELLDRLCVPRGLRQARASN